MGASDVARRLGRAQRVAVLFLACACSSVKAPEPLKASPSPPPLELWVDGHASEGGDGSRGRPLRQLEAALAQPSPHRRVHLASGLYAGPFSPPPGTELVGGTATVLTAPAGVTVVEGQGELRLTQILVQGGTLGVRSGGQLFLNEVGFSGQRAGAVAVLDGGRLEAEGVRFEASVSGGVGLLLARDSATTVTRCEFEGPWQRGIDAHAPRTLQVVHSHFRGSVTALQLVGGTAAVSDVTVSEGRGPGLFVSAGRLEVHRVQVSGQEYALLTGKGAVVEAEDLVSTRADRAGVGMVNAEGHFARLTITGAGTLGGLQSLFSQVTVDGLRVEDVAGIGVFQREGTLRLEGASVKRTRERDGSAADAVQLRGGRAWLHTLSVQTASGACLTAAEGAEVVLSAGVLEGCHSAGLVVESRARLSVSDVVVQGSAGPAAVATEEGHLQLRSFRALSTDGVVWAECNKGAHVTTWKVSGTLPSVPCLEPLSAPPAE